MSTSIAMGLTGYRRPTGRLRRVSPCAILALNRYAPFVLEVQQVSPTIATPNSTTSPPQVVKEQLTTIQPMHAHKRKDNTTASVLQECYASLRDFALVKPGRSCYLMHGTRIGCTEVSSHAL